MSAIPEGPGPPCNDSPCREEDRLGLRCICRCGRPEAAYTPPGQPASHSRLDSQCRRRLQRETPSRCRKLRQGALHLQPGPDSAKQGPRCILAPVLMSKPPRVQHTHR